MKRKNLVVIMTDDQGYWTLGCAGNPDAHTPNIDRLAERGVYFENFFCVSPVCSPARASFFTGNIPSAHGVTDWLDGGNIDAITAATISSRAFIDAIQNAYRAFMGEPDVHSAASPKANQNKEEKK